MNLGSITSTIVTYVRPIGTIKVMHYEHIGSDILVDINDEVFNDDQERCLRAMIPVQMIRDWYEHEDDDAILHALDIDEKILSDFIHFAKSELQWQIKSA